MAGATDKSVRVTAGERSHATGVLSYWMYHRGGSLDRDRVLSGRYHPQLGLGAISVDDQLQLWCRSGAVTGALR